MRKLSKQPPNLTEMKKTTMVLMTTKKMVPRVGVAAVAALVVVTTEKKVVLHNTQVVQRLTLLAEAEFTRTIVFDI